MTLDPDMIPIVWERGLEQASPSNLRTYGPMPDVQYDEVDDETA